MPTKKILITKSGRRFFVRDTTKDFHSQFGYVKTVDLKKKNGIVVSNTGHKFFIFSPSFIDLYQKIKRVPQIIPLKDIALITAETGINKKSKVVDAGSGSGALACFLANLVKEVTTYEIRKDFIKVVEHNVKLTNLKNIKIKNKDIYKGIDGKNVDLVTLDLPEPWQVINHAAKALKIGGFLVSYSPTIPQTSDFVKEINKSSAFVHIKTTEIIEREWEFDKRRIRPKSSMLGHSGFLSFARKVR